MCHSHLCMCRGQVEQGVSCILGDETGRRDAKPAVLAANPEAHKMGRTILFEASPSTREAPSSCVHDSAALNTRFRSVSTPDPPGLWIVSAHVDYYQGLTEQKTHSPEGVHVSIMAVRRAADGTTRCCAAESPARQ